MPNVTSLAIGSLAVGVVVLGLKYLAYLITGSVALYSDALESMVNVGTAVATLVAVRMSARPADANHPYGHHKAEYFSAVLVGVMIVVAAILILREAYYGFLDPRALDAPFRGLVVSGVATVVNASWCWFLISRGRRHRSPALVADGKHLLADVVTTVGVVLGVLFATASGLMILDPALAALVAVNILWSGWRVVRESLGGLMDEAVPESTLAQIRDVISLHADGALEVHDLRTRQAGRITFIDFHLVAPTLMTVSDAHEICDRIERGLKEGIGNTLVTIHVEPEYKAKHSGVLVL